MSTVAPVTVAQLIDRALAAHAALAELGETVGDEWQYVTDLGVVWQGRLNAVKGARGTETASAETVAAIEALAAEASRITDPHRAIDWLSTLPQVALLALGEAS
jgi:hypothetical protein